MNIDKDQLGLQLINDRNPGHGADAALERQPMAIYEPPRVISYTDQDILELLGPAQTGGEYGR